MDIIDEAIKSMCKSVTGGYATVASLLGITKAGLENRLYKNKGQRIDIDEAMIIQRISNRTDFAEAVARESGGVFLALPHSDNIVDEDIQAQLLSAAEDLGDLIRKQREFTEDGELDPVERKRLNAARDRVFTSCAAAVELTEKYYTRQTAAKDGE